MRRIETSRIKRIFYNRYLIIILFFILMIFIDRSAKKFSKKFSKNPDYLYLTKNLENKINYLKNVNDSLNNEINYLKNTISSYENKLILLDTKISNFEDGIVKIENSNPVNNERNIQIVILLNKINNLYYSNIDFSNEIESLKILAKNKVDIYDKILKLKDFSGNNSSFNNLKNEYRNLISNSENNEGKLNKFISSNIQIRKVKNNKVDDKNNDISIIEHFILKKNYVDCLNFINDKKYNNYFVNTVKTLRNNIDFDETINFIINNIYNNY